MSMAQGSEPRQEIIIVRRNHHDHDESHHGGVWKIAFADFMTAMMCFFLVMWLVNAANEQTKSGVASYFNPVQLTDRNSSRRGLEDVGDGPSNAGMTADDPQDAATKAGRDGRGNAGTTRDKNDNTNSSQGTGSADERMFADPYAMLAEIVAETGVLQNVSSEGDGGAQTAGPATGASGGESYRDPFAPDFWSQQMATPLAEASAERADTKGEPVEPQETVAQAQAVKPATAVPPSARAFEAAPLEPLAGQADKPTEPVVTQGPAQDNAAEEVAKAAAARTAADMKAELAAAFDADDKVGKGISVEVTDRGVVISVTDQFDFGMFEIGSAVPSRDLVLAMDKIGRIINGHKGRIGIQGHTDARPFRSDTYDNWRLSTARAHAAYYMLVRGGIDEQRITEVAGFADRRPKDAADPLAAINRRIEILLETDG